MIALVTVMIIAIIIIAFYLGFLYRKTQAEKFISSAEEEAKKIIKNAHDSAQTQQKQIILEGKDEIHKLKIQTEHEFDDRRKDLNYQEKRLLIREENLDKKEKNLVNKEFSLDKKSNSLEKLSNHLKLKENRINERLSDAENIRNNQLELLEKISGFTVKQAKDYILSNLDDELVHEKAIKIKQFEQNLRDECNEKAKEILSIAIQKCASDHYNEPVISVVPLPNDDMKGRVIGREGRNIRAFENLTGVDLIIDDTPEAITLSSFDPVRREIAKLSLEYLIQDGRIHPAKIEELFEKATREVNKIIQDAGQHAVFETGVNNIHPMLVKTLGKLKFRTSYGQNVLNHSIEVANLCAVMAAELGLDINIAKKAGLLHDIGKALDHEVEGSHVDIGVDLAKKYGENEQVIHAIQAHHGDIEPKSSIAFILQAADSLSAARPGARRENLENYIKRLQKLESIVLSFSGVEKCFAIQAGREVRVMIRPELVDDEKMIPLARQICKKIESDLDYPGQVKVSLIRESRTTEYAK